MYKIYSRSRIKIPNLSIRKKNINNKISKKIVIILLIVAIAFLTIKHTLDAVSPVYDTLCNAKAKSIATTVSNEETMKIMKKYLYEDLFTVEKDSNNNITMIKSKTNTINKISNEISLNIQKEIDNRGREDISIAMR